MCGMPRRQGEFFALSELREIWLLILFKRLERPPAYWGVPSQHSQANRRMTIPAAETMSEKTSMP